MTNDTTINLINKIMKLDDTHVITGYQLKYDEMGNIMLEAEFRAKRYDAFD